MPFNPLIVLERDKVCFLIDTSTCAQQGSIEFPIGIAESRSIMISILLEWFLLAVVRSQSKVEDTIAYLSGNPTEKR